VPRSIRRSVSYTVEGAAEEVEHSTLKISSGHTHISLHIVPREFLALIFGVVPHRVLQSLLEYLAEVVFGDAGGDAHGHLDDENHHQQCGKLTSKRRAV